MYFENGLKSTWLRSSDVILVTGGSSGLGFQLVKRLATRGYTVASLDVRMPSAEAKVASVLYIECDVTDYNSVYSARDTIESSLGTVTVLVNNAGICRPITRIENADLEDISSILNVNLLGSFITTKVFLPSMVQRERGLIAIVASALGLISPAGLSAYGASKAGLLGLFESLTYELAKSPILTLLILPGQIDTEMFANVKTPSRFLAPVLDAKELAEQIVDRLVSGSTRTIFSPLYVNLLPFMRVLPSPVVRLLRRVSGVDEVLNG